MGIALSLHVLAAVIWVGGMFFAYIVLRPVAAELLAPPERLHLWVQIFQRFFPWVWLAIVGLLATGLWMILSGFGGFSEVGWHVHGMFVIACIMVLLFIYLYFKPFQQLQKNVVAEQWPIAAAYLNKIRRIIALNLSLGVLVIMIATIGQYITF